MRLGGNSVCPRCKNLILPVLNSRSNDQRHQWCGSVGSNPACITPEGMTLGKSWDGQLIAATS